MDVTIGQSSYVSNCLASLVLLPESVSEDVILAKYSHHLVILNDFQRAGDDEAKIVYALTRVVEEVTRGTKSRISVRDNFVVREQRNGYF